VLFAIVKKRRPRALIDVRRELAAVQLGDASERTQEDGSLALSFGETCQLDVAEANDRLVLLAVRQRSEGQAEDVNGQSRAHRRGARRRPHLS